jgi:hypothetical protein
MSEFLAKRKRELSERVPEIVASRFNVMRGAGRVEIMQEAIVPLALDIMSIIVGLNVSTANCQSVSAAFDKLININKRRRIAADMATLKKAIESQLGPQASQEDIGLRLALLVLGRDPLVGTLGESLYRLLANNPDRYLSDIGYPEIPPETGVPVIERIVVTPFQFAGCHFEAGDRLRIYLQSFAYARDHRTRASFFGGGAHTCLGRPLSIEVWKAITGLLSAVRLRTTVLSYARRDSDYVFVCPEHLEVELRA